MNYYVYRLRDGKYIYERTCGTQDAAEAWVRQYGPGAVYLVNHTIRGAYY